MNINRTDRPGKRLHALDSLRGLAALVVVWHHIVVILPRSIDTLKTQTPLLYTAAIWISDQNKNAVLVFFVLSGWSIRLAIERDDLFATGGLGTYIRRRAARILPLYWLALGWTAVLSLVHKQQDESFNLSALLGNIALLQTSASARGMWFPPYGLNGPLWSLSYEVFYYSLLPAIVLAMGSTRARHPRAMDLMLIGSLFTSIAAIAMGRFAPNPISEFLGGWAVWMYGWALGECVIRKYMPYSLLVPAPVAIVVSWAADSIGLHSATLSQLSQGLVLGTLMSVCTFSCIKLPEEILRKAEKSLDAVFLRVGGGSFALYLLHYPLLLSMAEMWRSFDIGSTFSLIGTVVVSSAFALIFCPWLEFALKEGAQQLFKVDRYFPQK